MVDHHKLLREARLRELHEKMLRFKITLEELADFAKTYNSHSSLMKAHRAKQIAKERMQASLEKARAAKVAKKIGGNVNV
jgi:hypothetical protein